MGGSNPEHLDEGTFHVQSELGPAIALPEGSMDRDNAEMGPASMQNHNNLGTHHTQPMYDPRALLNPGASWKRPVSDADADGDQGPIDAVQAGQVALVERLHNVSQRMASPAKRVKTEDGERKQQPTSSLPAGSALSFKPKDDGPSPPRPAESPAIDLTMSKCAVF